MITSSAVANTAAVLRELARAGDRQGAARVLERLSAVQMADLVFTLATATAAPAPVSQERLAHRAVGRLRTQGLLMADMPAWVVKGEREFQRQRKARNRREQVLAARRAAQAQEEAA